MEVDDFVAFAIVLEPCLCVKIHEFVDDFGRLCARSELINKPLVVHLAISCDIGTNLLLDCLIHDFLLLNPLLCQTLIRPSRILDARIGLKYVNVTSVHLNGKDIVLEDLKFVTLRRDILGLSSQVLLIDCAIFSDEIGLFLVRGVKHLFDDAVVAAELGVVVRRNNVCFLVDCAALHFDEARLDLVNFSV